MMVVIWVVKPFDECVISSTLVRLSQRGNAVIYTRPWYQLKVVFADSGEETGQRGSTNME